MRFVTTLWGATTRNASTNTEPNIQENHGNGTKTGPLLAKPPPPPNCHGEIQVDHEGLSEQTEGKSKAPGKEDVRSNQKGIPYPKASSF